MRQCWLATLCLDDDDDNDDICEYHQYHDDNDEKLTITMKVFTINSFSYTDISLCDLESLKHKRISF